MPQKRGEPMNAWLSLLSTGGKGSHGEGTRGGRGIKEEKEEAGWRGDEEGT